MKQHMTKCPVCTHKGIKRNYPGGMIVFLHPVKCGMFGIECKACYPRAHEELDRICDESRKEETK